MLAHGGVTVLAAPTAAADAGQKGSTINEEKTFITGTVQAPPNSAVAVNGQLATRTDDGRFFVNDVPLTEGANTLTVKVTTQDNQTSKQSINVNRMGRPISAISESMSIRQKASRRWRQS